VTPLVDSDGRLIVAPLAEPRPIALRSMVRYRARQATLLGLAPFGPGEALPELARAASGERR
jgi:hypothetical protein